MAREYGLGRGLSSLIPNKAPTASGAFSDQRSSRQTVPEPQDDKNRVMEISVEQIKSNPHQPRTRFDEQKLAELSDSIKEHGILQPLVVSKVGSGFEIIAGERRYMAAKKAGLTKVPVIVRDAGEKEKLELAIIENTQRHDLNPIEEAKAYRKLENDFQMTQEEVSHKMGKSRSAVANKTRLLTLPVDVQKAIIEGRLSEGHAKVLLSVDNQEKLRALFDLIIKEELTVRETEEKTREVKVKSHLRSNIADPETHELEEKLTATLGSKVRISRSLKHGKITIDYYSKEERDTILNRLSGEKK